MRRQRQPEELGSQLLEQHGFQAGRVVQIVAGGAASGALDVLDGILVAERVELADLVDETTTAEALEAGYIGFEDF